MIEMENKGAEITAKVIALQDERIRKWDELKSNVETAMTIANILYYKDRFWGILRYIAAYKLMRGYYTPEEMQAIQICTNEINECDKTLNNLTEKAIEDKIVSLIAEMLSKD